MKYLIMWLINIFRRSMKTISWICPSALVAARISAKPRSVCRSVTRATLLLVLKRLNAIATVAIWTVKCR